MDVYQNKIEDTEDSWIYSDSDEVIDLSQANMSDEWDKVKLRIDFENKRWDELHAKHKHLSGPELFELVRAENPRKHYSYIYPKT